MEQQLSEQERIRRDKLNELRRMGINPYPAPEYHVSHVAADIKARFAQQPEAFTQVRIAGRLMSMRDMGKACFAVLQDHSGRLQMYVRKDDICPGDDKSLFDIVFKKLLDIGDIMGAEGYVFTTKTGEISLHVKHFTLLSKALRPLPIVKTDDSGQSYDAVSDPEFRYRQRYVDLIINPQVRDTFVKRSKIINCIRRQLNAAGMLEVETPILQSIPGGATARPFITHHNALDIPLYLRIANELYLKRLIVGGFDGVYEFAKDFRNEGMDRTHNPEFTVLEFYVAYKDYHWMMQFCETLLEQVVLDLYGSTAVQVGATTINFKAPFARLSMREALLQHAGIDISTMDEAALREACKQRHIATEAHMGRGKLIDALFGETCEGHCIQPTFITDYPVDMSPLTKAHRSLPGYVERFELMVNGKELANAYTELNDPLEQRTRFDEQLKLQARGDDEAMFIDHDFLRALEYAMPPTAGIGIGIDRLTMLLTNQAAIQEVLFFPQMRPQHQTPQTHEQPTT